MQIAYYINLTYLYLILINLLTFNKKKYWIAYKLLTWPETI